MTQSSIPPRVVAVPDSAGSFGAQAEALAGLGGLTLDDWQSDVLEAWLAVDSRDMLVAARCGITVPRQNGKTAMLEARALYGTVAWGERVLWTAHEVKTARAAFRRILGFFELPEFARFVKNVRTANGQEALYLKNGGSIEFIARSKSSGRGFTADVLLMDEAQELSDDVLAALLPTISAAPKGNPQQILAGTPPAPNMTGDVFKRTRDAAVEGSDPALAWHEWSAEDDADPDDEAVWRQANPALGSRLQLSTVAAERAAMDEVTFRRERLGSWATAAQAGVLDMDVWNNLVDQASEPGPGLVLAVDVSPDRSMASIGVASERRDGVVHLEIIDNRAGTGWLVPRLRKIRERHGAAVVVMDALSAAASLEPDMRRAGLRVIKTSLSDLADACGLFFDAVQGGAVRHLGSPVLDAALRSARRRKLRSGEAWAWSRATSEADITPLVSVTLALWGVKSAKVPSGGRSARKVLVM